MTLLARVARRSPVATPTWTVSSTRFETAVTPFVALGLFLLLHTWFVFLLIPAVGALLGSNHHRPDHRHRRS